MIGAVASHVVFSPLLNFPLITCLFRTFSTFITLTLPERIHFLKHVLSFCLQKIKKTTITKTLNHCCLCSLSCFVVIVFVFPFTTACCFYCRLSLPFRPNFSGYFYMPQQPGLNYTKYSRQSL